MVVATANGCAGFFAYFSSHLQILGRKGRVCMITAYFRTIILYVVLIIGLRLLGKRQIADLEPIELVLTLTISDLAAVPMQDHGIPLLNGLLPIVTLLCLSMLLSFFNLKSIRFRAIVCGTPAVIVRDGTIIQQNMAKNRLTVDELYEQLRSQGYSDLRAVKYAILETNGQLSILPYTRESPLTPQGAGLTLVDRVTLPVLIINDGHVMENNLTASGFNREWLERQLKDRKFSSHREVFLMTVDEAGTIICVAKEEMT